MEVSNSPLQLWMPTTSPGFLLPVLLLTNRLVVRGSHSPFLSFDSLVRIAHRTQRNILLLDYQFIWTQMNIQMEGVGKGHRASMLSPRGPLFPSLHVFTNPEAL